MADEKPISERVSVLEIRADHHENMLKDTFTSLITQAERTNTILERFEEKVDATALKVAQWDTVAKTIVKVAIVMSVVIGGAWTLFAFVVDHSEMYHLLPKHETTALNDIQ